jgi:hypothetical protein
MRAMLFTLSIIAVLGLSSCGGGPGSKAKSAGSEIKPRDVIVGVWKIKRNDPLDPHIQSYEFAADNTVKVMCLNAKEPIKGKYTFVNDYAMEVEYDATEEARQAYAAAVKAYKDSGTETAKKDSGKITPQIQGNMAAMFGRIPDDLPAKEKLTVLVRSIPAGDGDKHGAELIVKNEKDFSLTYRKEE